MYSTLSQDVLGLLTDSQLAIGDTPKQKTERTLRAHTQSRGVRGKNIAAYGAQRRSVGEAAAAELVRDMDDCRRVAASSAGLRNRCAETAQTHTNTAVENRQSPSLKYSGVAALVSGSRAYSRIFR
jgi:hypothetical protein